eukprot:c29753_g1_i1 orf=396-554(+)
MCVFMNMLSVSMWDYIYHLDIFAREISIRLHFDYAVERPCVHTIVYTSIEFW